MARIPYRPVGGGGAPSGRAPARTSFNPTLGAPTRLRAAQPRQPARPAQRQLPQVGAWASLPGAFANLARTFRAGLADQRRMARTKFDASMIRAQADLGAQLHSMSTDPEVGDIEEAFGTAFEAAVGGLQDSDAYKTLEGDPYGELAIAKLQQSFVNRVAAISINQAQAQTQRNVQTHMKRWLSQVKEDPGFVTQAQQALDDVLDNSEMTPDAREALRLQSKHQLQSESYLASRVEEQRPADPYDDRAILDSQERWTLPRITYSEGAESLPLAAATELSRAVARIDTNLNAGVIGDGDIVLMSAAGEIIRDPEPYYDLIFRMKRHGHNVNVDQSIELNADREMMARIEGGLAPNDSPAYNLLKPNERNALDNRAVAEAYGISQRAIGAKAKQLFFHAEQQFPRDYDAMEAWIDSQSDGEMELQAMNILYAERRRGVEALRARSEEKAEEASKALIESEVLDLTRRNVSRDTALQVINGAWEGEDRQYAIDIFEQQLSLMTKVAGDAVATEILAGRDPSTGTQEVRKQFLLEHDAAQKRETREHNARLRQAEAAIYPRLWQSDGNLSTLTRDPAVREAFKTLAQDRDRFEQLMSSADSVAEGQIAARVSDGRTENRLLQLSDADVLNLPPGSFGEYKDLTIAEQRRYDTRYANARKARDGSLRPGWSYIESRLNSLTKAAIADGDMEQEQLNSIRSKMLFWFEGLEEQPDRGTTDAMLATLMTPVSRIENLGDADTYYGATFSLRDESGREVVVGDYGDTAAEQTEFYLDVDRMTPVERRNVDSWLRANNFDPDEIGSARLYGRIAYQLRLGREGEALRLAWGQY